MLICMISTSLSHHCEGLAFILKLIRFIHLIQSLRPNDKNGKAKSIYFTHANICRNFFWVKVHVTILLLSMYSKLIGLKGLFQK